MEMKYRNSKIWVLKLTRPPKTGQWQPEKILGLTNPNKVPVAYLKWYYFKNQDNADIVQIDYSILPSLEQKSDLAEES